MLKICTLCLLLCAASAPSNAAEVTDGSAAKKDDAATGGAAPAGKATAEQAPAAPEGAAPAPKAPTAGWEPDKGGFVVRTEDESYLLKFGLQSAYKFEPLWENGVSQQRAAFFLIRPSIGGNLFQKWIHFRTSLELAANPVFLLNSWVEFAFLKEFEVRVGQQDTPWSRHEWYGPQEILFPEWDFVADIFWTGRDKGITIHGVPAAALEYWVGLYSGSPLREFVSTPGNFLVQARATITPIGSMGPTEFAYAVLDKVPFSLSFTAQGYAARLQQTEANFNPDTGLFRTVPNGKRSRDYAVGADVALQGGPFAFTVEGYFRRTDYEDGTPIFNSLGAWAQASYFLSKHVGLGLRGSWFDPSSELQSDQMFGIEGTVVWLLDPKHLHLHLRYGYGHQQTPAAVDLGPVSLPIQPGDAHVVTAQIGVYF
jgi:hypothetical protein